MIVDVPGKHVVYAGSENLTGPSIHTNDYVMVRSTSASVLSGYRSYFATNRAWSKSRRW